MTIGEINHREFIVELDFEGMTLVNKRENRKNIEYYNIACSYDIETSSFKQPDGTKVALTYAHTLDIDGYVFKMETWDELKESLDLISDMAGLHDGRRLVVYVHNLAYEFQFMKHQFNWNHVFANGGDRNILSARTDNGIEFRCNMMLAGGVGLSTVANNLTVFDIKKLEGDLDYDLIRHPETPITEKELEYMLNDVLIIEYYIRECLVESGNDITKIPLTSTGYVRNYCRQLTIKGKEKEKKKYRDLMKSLTVEEEEYMMLRTAFAGGYTHSNVEHTGKTMYNVSANDYSSSYPGCMVAYQYPMSKGEDYQVNSKQEFYDQLDTHCCLFYIRFHGITRKANEAYISLSKTQEDVHATINNGRIESAELIGMWMTDIDFECVKMSYDIDDFEVRKLYRYKRGYLPTSFIRAVLKLFEDKTKLKGVVDAMTEYNRSKGMINSTYGMIVMDIIQTTFEWNDLHKTNEIEIPDVAHLIEHNNKSRNRFIYYPWGVWITAYARYNLFKEVVRLEDDYIYCDTDSVYFTNEEENVHIFEESNERILDLLEKACDYHGFDYSILSPVDPKGVKHTIGLWEHDGHYNRFKTLGAKRYMVEDDEFNVNITVSGVNKRSAVPYLTETYGDGIFDVFDTGLVIPEGACGKSTHTYIDEARVGVVEDYLGVSYEYVELSGVHLEETSYAMSISDEYAELIEWIQQKPLG